LTWPRPEAGDMRQTAASARQIARRQLTPWAQSKGGFPGYDL
jgi:hypothetical protein